MSNPEAGSRSAVHALAENFVRTRYEDLPAETVRLTKMDILDTLGVSLAAAVMAPVCAKVIELVAEIGGRPDSTIIGDGRKVPAHTAALANAALAHALNYDDYLDPLITHFGCVIFPAAFAMAERVGGVNGKELITAYALGVDLGARLNRALITRENQRDWQLHGWLTTQLTGYFGAAAVAARLQGLDASGLLNALGLAYSQVAGNKQPLIGTGADKGIYPCYPAHSGVLAALMAHKGIAGPKDSLEGQAGLYRVFFQGVYDPAALTLDLGRRFDSAGFHIYPCCSFTHTRIELAMNMMREHRLRAEDIEAITLHAGPMSRLLCEPLEVRRNPSLMAEAQYSLPFTVAVAIAKGRPRIEHFSAEGLRDAAVLAVSNKVVYRFDQRYDLRHGTGVCPARLEFRMKDGTMRVGELDGVRYGHPERSITMDDLIEKFRECAAYSRRALPAATVNKAIAMVERLEEVGDVSEIVRLVS